ncbi:serum response factor homolog isoform X2 [Brevipalpus obovatus]|uniref:serum response factor homolog isoform X2 n=1 Tax=Brevipalpus obovatus TaxID=246614 RepID=UPI003D9ECE6F
MMMDNYTTSYDPSCYLTDDSDLGQTLSNGGGTKRKLNEYVSVDENGVNQNGEPLSKKLQANGKKTKGRVKIKMEFIDNKLRRYTTFSKRKSGIMKKAYELSTLTGTQVMLLVASETGHVYTFATRKLKPMITSEAGKALIRTCLFSPEPPASNFEPRMSAAGYEETELSYSLNEDSSEKGDDDVYRPSSTVAIPIVDSHGP